MFPSRAYLCYISQCFVLRCFVLSLICTFVVSYFLYFVAFQIGYFTLQFFYTLLFRPFCTGTLFQDTFIPWSYALQYLCSPIPVFPGPMFSSTYISRSYVPRSICSPVHMFPEHILLWQPVDTLDTNCNSF